MEKEQLREREHDLEEERERLEYELQHVKTNIKRIQELLKE